MGVEVAVIAAVGGAALEMYGNNKEGKAKQRAANAQAAAKRRQAAEILRRTDIQLEQLAKDTDDFIAGQASAFAAGGVDVGSGVSLLMFEDTQKKATDERIQRLEEARWQAQELEFGALSDVSIGKDAREAANIANIGTAINAGGNIYGLTGK